MKLSYLQLSNTLSHDLTALDFGGLTVLRGDNGSGKSTLVAAVQELLAASCDYADGKNGGVTDLIRSGADKAEIIANIFDSGETRTLTCEIGKRGRTVKCRKESDAGYTGSDYLGMLASKSDILACLVNGKFFFQKKEAEQKELLASIILPSTIDIDAWVWPAMEQCGVPVLRNLIPFDLIAEAYEAAFKERTAINRAIKEWREPDKPAAIGMPVADIRAKLKERQDARTALAVKKNEALGKWSIAKDKRAKLNDKLQALENKLVIERQRRSTVDADLLSKAQIKEHEAIAKSGAKAEEIDKQIAANAAELRNTRKWFAEFNDAGEVGKCPLCTRGIPDEVAAAISDQIAAKIREFTEKDDSLQTQRKALGDYEGAKRNLEKHAVAEKNVALVDSHIAEVEKDLTSARKELETEVPTQPDTSSIDTEIADFDARIEKGNAALQQAVATETLAGQYQRAIEAKKQLDAKQELLTKLCDYFGPKGVQAKLLGESVEPFEQAMNAVLAGWGFECRLQFEPYAFDVRFQGKDRFYPLKTMSASQRAMFAVAFQVALAKVSGFNFVWVDAADIFLDANRTQLYRNLMGAKLEQVVVLQSDQRREIPKAPDSAFYMLSLDKGAEVPRTIAERLQ